MEVLPRALAARAHCVRHPSSRAQDSSSSAAAASSSCSLQNSLKLGSIVASSCSLVASWLPVSLALSYDDFMKGPDSFYDSNAADSFFFIDFDAATDYMSSNPVAFLAGLAAVGVPLITFTALAIPQTFGSVSAAEAFTNLAQPNTQLLDIRVDTRSEGTPNLRSLRKKAVQVAYNAGEDADAFVAKVVAKFKDPATTTLCILDRVDGNSLNVAKLLANNGFEGAFAIKGGVEGPNGWKKKELPWLAPRKGFSFNLDGLKDVLNGKDASILVPTSLGVAAAAGIGAVFFAEVESAMQLLGSAALVQFFLRKFLFAKDREKTLQDMASFLDTKIAPKDFADELKEVGRVLLPKDGEVKAAVETGAAELEEKLKVDSSTPEVVAGKVA